MTLNGTEPLVREYHFDRGSTSGEFTGTTAGSGQVTLGGFVDGMALASTGGSDRAYATFNDKLPFDIDDLISVEYLLKIPSWNAASYGVFGVGSAYNADPDVVAASAWFKIVGGTNGRNLVIETDDGTTDRNDIATGIEVPLSTWMRLRMDFKSGIQSISPPAQSKGGKASVQFACTDAKGFMRHVRPNVHMDMSAYSGALQLYMGIAGNAGTCYIKRIVVHAREAAA